MGDWRLWWYYGIQLAGGACLVLMLATVFSPWNRVRCNPVLTSFCVTWLLTTPILCFLLFTRSATGDPPSQGVCLASAALVMSQTNLVATAGLALVAHVYTLLSASLRHRFTSPWFLNIALLVAAPYAVFTLTVFIVLGLGLAHPDKVHRVVFYCVVDIDALTITIGVYDAICLVATIFFEILIVIGMRREHPSSFSHRIEPQLVWRVALFGVYALIALGLSIFSAVDWTSVVPDMVLCTFALAMFVTFGSQKAILSQWQSNLTYPCRRVKEASGSKLVHLPSGSGSSFSGKKAKGMGSSDSPAPTRVPAPRVHFKTRGGVPAAVPEDDIVDINGSHELMEIGGDPDRKNLDPFTITTIDEVDSFDAPVERKYSSRVPRFMNPPPRRQHHLSTTLHEASTNGGTTFEQNDTRISFAPPGSTIHSTPSYMQ
ncbi:hypothetical protein EXIGLDRAFT_720899 [Exidia glandulosa HHB12029]|uniref:G-protein coupled receptors family 1 profile domain-containing protein n=1 Tax=Exidia glandulosa HHB12029 TaxID=1314781 RepID=A0A166BFR7_EXIGL|nr:hypothetical protein EXIGLDRAFT_720899 [Exidia glandulosa HHB12029]